MEEDGALQEIVIPALDITYRMFGEKAGTTKVIVASRYEESPVFLIEKSPAIDVKNDHRISGDVLQLSLF